MVNAQELFGSLKAQTEETIKPQSLFKTLTARVIPSEKSKAEKRQKLTGHNAIDKGKEDCTLFSFLTLH